MELQGKEEFSPDYSVAKLAALGILGFITGCVILFHSDLFTKGPSSVFHEVVYNPREIADSTMKRAKDSLEKLIRKKNVDLRNIDSNVQLKSIQAKTDSGKSMELAKQLKRDIDSLSKQKTKLTNENQSDTVKVKQLSFYNQYYEDLSRADTSGFNKLNKALHFDISPGSLQNWEDSFNTKGYDYTRSVKSVFKDPEGKLADKISCNTDFIIKQSTSDIVFFDKYPSAGIWVLLILVFCSFCFISIATAINLQDRICKIFEEEKHKVTPKKNYGWICVFTAAVMLVMYTVWYSTFFDDPVIKNIFFMKGMIASLNWVIVLGSGAGVFCIAGFIYSASMLSFLADPLIQIRKEIKQQAIDIQKTDVLNALDPDQAATTTDDKTALAQKQADEAMQKSMFEKLANVFQNYFVLAAINLSLTIFCTGALFNTINSLEFVKLLSDDWGYSPLRSDFIYFYGALFTILLLLVYVPAKIKFSEVDVWNKPATDANSKWYDVIKNPFGQLKDVMVAASPLLASFAQSLLDILFK